MKTTFHNTEIDICAFNSHAKAVSKTCHFSAEQDDEPQNVLRSVHIKGHVAGT